jgi:ketosteroid isomerase-like protein
MRQLFSDFLKTGEGSAVLAVAADDIRVYRRGMIPAVGKAAAQLAVGSERGKTSRTRSGGGMSDANDLAYEYGEYTSERGGAPEQGIYFCIWRPDAEGNWKLVLDLQKKAPEKK